METYKTADFAIQNYNENQLIYDEFNYYQEHRKILGVHKVFRVLKLKASISKMREARAVKRLANLTNYINRGKRNLNNITDETKRSASLEKIKLWEEEHDLIKNIKQLHE